VRTDPRRKGGETLIAGKKVQGERERKHLDLKIHRPEPLWKRNFSKRGGTLILGRERGEGGGVPDPVE